MKKHLLKNLDALAEDFEGRNLSFFLDYDGTLTPIVSRPERALLSYKMKEALRGVMRRYPVAIISGRAMGDLKEKVVGKAAVYAANHGMEISSENFTFVCDIGAEAAGELKSFTGEARALSKKYKGVIVEDKGATLSVHYRLLDARKVKEFLRAAKQAAAPLVKSGLVRLSEGKKVLEMRPSVSWDKGEAVKWILDRAPFISTYPIYIGDDETDFDAFRALKGRGVSVYVGGACKESDYYLKSPDEVVRFFVWLQGLAQRQAQLKLFETGKTRRAK